MILVWALVSTRVRIWHCAGEVRGPCRSKGLRGDAFAFRRPDSEASGRTESSGASFGIRLHRGSHVLTPGEHRNRINRALSALPVRFSRFSRIASAFHCALPLALESALYCASPFVDYRSTRQKHIGAYGDGPRNLSEIGATV
jgi:hypothetical protein